MYFSEVRIDKVRGIGRGEGFVLNQLSPGINIIYGPNASGKSTTSRVLQELLWPGRTGLGPAAIQGRLHHDKSQFVIEGDAGHFEILRDGAPAPPPDCGPPENRVRYNPALHELIQADNQGHDFARRIAEASQGGFDLTDASQALGYQDSPPAKRRESQALREINDHLKSVESRLTTVQRDELRLNSLRAEYNESLKAGMELRLLEAASEYQTRNRELQEAENRLASMPGVVERLRGDEADILESLDAREADLRDRLLTANDNCRKAQAILDICGFQNGPPGAGTLERLKVLDRTAAKLDEDLRFSQSDANELDARVTRSLGLLGKHFSQDQIENLSQISIPALDDFCRKVDDYRSRKAALVSRNKWINELALGGGLDAYDTRVLHSGCSILVQWLASQKGRNFRAVSLLSILIWFAVVLHFIGVGLLAWYQNPLWSLGAVPGFIILILEFRHRHKESESAAAHETVRRVHMESYGRLPLPQPDSWESDTVRSLLDQLVELSTLVSFNEHLHRLEKDNASMEAEIDQVLGDLELQKKVIHRQLGLDTDVDDLSFARLVRLIGDWQDAANRADARHASLNGTVEELDDVLDEVNELLRLSGENPVDSYDALSVRLPALESRITRYESTRQSLESSDNLITQYLEPQLAEIENTRNSLIHRLQITSDQIQHLPEWLSLRDEWVSLRRQADECRFVLRQNLDTLQDRADLLDLDESQLAGRMATSRSLMERREDLHAEILGIERDIRLASEGHDLTDALAARESRLVALRDARDESTSAVVGGILARWIRRVSFDRSRPDVFQRANELLGAFTKYTLQLEIHDQTDTPVFMARRGDGPLQSVNELSVGERVQLLLAVRVAFMELDEKAKLPMFLDETLGTSDDYRADMIISAVAELARQGRQIFYFTAQKDEVAKWKSALKQFSVPFRISDLGQIRQLQSATHFPIADAASRIPEIPHPKSNSYEKYGQLLSVPGLNPLSLSPDQVHLWHVMDDTRELHSLLRLHITTCGQLKTFAEASHANDRLIDPELLHKTLTAIRILEATIREWSRGRTRPIDRQVLQDSGVVSDAFLDTLADLSRRLSGDAAALIAALENREVSRWRHDNTGSLRDYLSEHGYLTCEKPQTLGQIRSRILATASTAISDNIISSALIERILRSLPDCV